MPDLGMPFYIAIAVFAVLLITIIIIMVVKNKNKDSEVPTSILDVNTEGVSETKDFSYGYEKEETVVMNPIEEEKKEEE